MNNSIKGSLSILSGAFLISFSPVFVNLVDIEPTVSGFYRMLFGSIALFIIYLIKNNENPLRKNISKFIVLGAIFLVWIFGFGIDQLFMLGLVYPHFLPTFKY